MFMCSHVYRRFCVSVSVCVCGVFFSNHRVHAFTRPPARSLAHSFANGDNVLHLRAFIPFTWNRYHHYSIGRLLLLLFCFFNLKHVHVLSMFYRSKYIQQLKTTADFNRSHTHTQTNSLQFESNVNKRRQYIRCNAIWKKNQAAGNFEIKLKKKISSIKCFLLLAQLFKTLEKKTISTCFDFIGDGTMIDFIEEEKPVAIPILLSPGGAKAKLQKFNWKFIVRNRDKLSFDWINEKRTNQMNT